MRQDELMHYGVPGMRWGHRKARPESPEHARYMAAKQQYKSANKAYNKSFNKAYGYSYRHAIGQYTNKKKKAESNRRWAEAYDMSVKLGDAKKTMKKAKAEYKVANKEAKAQYKQTDEYKAKRAKAIKTGAVVAGTALAAYGTYKVSKYVKSEAGRRSYEDGKYFIDAYLKNARKETNDATYWYNEARRVGADTDKRTKIVKSSTIDAVRYLKNPNDDRWQIYKR